MHDGGALIHRAGGVEDAAALLPGLVGRADVTLFPVDCISHNAMAQAKRVCQQLSKPFVPLRTSSLACLLSVLPALRRIAEVREARRRRAASEARASGISCAPWRDRLRMGDTRLTLRVDFGGNRSIGPGKVRLLEAVGRTGSISQAGRELGMSYRRAWLLINDLNLCFQQPVVSAHPGGSQGGGAELTKFGQKLVADYRAIESDAFSATKSHLRDLESSLRPPERATAEKLKKTSIKSRTRA